MIASGYQHVLVLLDNLYQLTYKHYLPFAKPNVNFSAMPHNIQPTNLIFFLSLFFLNYSFLELREKKDAYQITKPFSTT